MCERGASFYSFFDILQCSKQHVLLCPQFESLGHCSRGKQCHLTHRRKRTEKKKNLVKKDQPIKCELFLSHTDQHPLLIRIDPLPSSSSSSLPNIMPAYIPLTQGD